MSYKTTTEKLADYRRQIAELRTKMRELQASVQPEEVKDYEFAASHGPVRLSELFGDKDTLFVIHNMGQSCPSCTLWADGFNGVYHHLADRAAFVVSSPDAPEVQKEFASGRGWRFPMVSHRGTSFATDMGYGSEDDGWQPGISVFRREDARIVRLSDAGFRPRDDFSTVWHILDLLPEGSAGWAPQFTYP
jgi:predicted dithiol-disulfide oxidoreductase (DUF899 family)